MIIHTLFATEVKIRNFPSLFFQIVVLLCGISAYIYSSNWFHLIVSI